MLSLGAIADLADKVGKVGQGEYLLTEYTEREGDSGQRRMQVTLEDASGRVTGFVWPESQPSALVLEVPSAVSVQAKVQHYRDQVQLNLKCVAPLRPDQVASASALLPLRQFSDATLPGLARLQQLEAELPAPLDDFFRRVLLDPDIGLPFIRCRGSQRHHHAYRGGLLVHATEQLNLCASLTRTIVPGDAYSPALAQLAYLFHDIGKLRSVGESARPEHGQVVRHEALTAEMLAPHLKWLEQRNFDLATGFRYVFQYLATPQSVRRVPDYVVAEIVATLDQWSVAAYHARGLDYLLHRHRRKPPEIRIDLKQEAANDASQPAEVRRAS